MVSLLITHGPSKVRDNETVFQYKYRALGHISHHKYSTITVVDNKFSEHK